MIEAYPSAYGAIYRQNKHCQDDLEIEQKLITKDWWKRFNTSIFGTILADAMSLHQSYEGPKYIENDTTEWFTSLVDEMIDNAVEEQRRSSLNTGQSRKVETIPNLLTSNNRRKGRTTNRMKQSRRFIHACPQKATYLCSVCSNKRGKAVLCYPPRSGRDCFEIHFQECHW